MPSDGGSRELFARGTLNNESGVELLSFTS
jgi:hypothetical protein